MGFGTVSDSKINNDDRYDASPETMERLFPASKRVTPVKIDPNKPQTEIDFDELNIQNPETRLH